MADMEIPKIIIQTGKSRKLSIISQVAVYTFKSLNPDFEWLFFDDDDVESFINTNFSAYKKVIASFKYKIQKYDFFRYLAIYHFGGFYFDLDVFLAKSLAPLLEHECVFSFEELNVFKFLRNEYNMDWAVGNYAFGATPKHPFIAALISNCIRAQTEPKWLEIILKPIPEIFRKDFFVLCSTGPGLVSRTIAEQPDISKGLTILFPDDVNDRRCWNHFGDFGVHLAAGEWRKSSGGPKKGIERFIYARWFEWMRNKQLKESHKIGPKRGIGSLKTR
jgi:inositol phosphorylceramide mannosyltransferase catalytic subunit